MKKNPVALGKGINAMKAKRVERGREINAQKSGQKSLVKEKKRYV